MRTIALSVVLAGWLLTTASAQEAVHVARCTGGPGDCVWLSNGKDGKDGRDGKDATSPVWPSVLAAYDFLVGNTTIQLTVPKRDGYHDKLLYRPGIAALVTRVHGQRCVQVAAPFHPEMPFTAATIDAERTFSWHDGSGYWSEPWDVTLPCHPF